MEHESVNAETAAGGDVGDGTYRLFMDECGSPKPGVRDEPPNDPPHFALGGVLVRGVDIESIRRQVQAFQQKWGLSYPLHSYEIRHKRDNFKWLATCEASEANRFHAELNSLIVASPVTICACVIHRQGYRSRYSYYGHRTWNLLRTAVSIVTERTAKHVLKIGGTRLGVTFESSGKREDTLIKQTFAAMKATGHPFNPNNAAKYDPLQAGTLATVLGNIKHALKSDEILQLADLCLYPVAYSRGTVRQARAYGELKNHGLLLDTHYPHNTDKLGIKYFCFDEGAKMTPPPKGGGAAT